MGNYETSSLNGRLTARAPYLYHNFPTFRGAGFGRSRPGSLGCGPGRSMRYVSNERKLPIEFYLGYTVHYL